MIYTLLKRKDFPLPFVNVYKSFTSKTLPTLRRAFFCGAETRTRHGDLDLMRKLQPNKSQGAMIARAFCIHVDH